MLISAAMKGLGNFSNPRVRLVFWRSIGLSILVFIALLIFVNVLLQQTAFFETAWLETGVDVLGGLAVFLVSLLLFPAAITAVISIFLDDVADAVEKTDYPHLPPARTPPVSEAIIAGARFFGIMVLLNVFLLVLLAVPIIFPFVFYGVNGYLVGREYFELVAQRRLSSRAYTQLRKRRRLTIFITGVLLVFLLTVPFVNLVMPIFATAMMVHLYHKMSKEA